VIEEVIIAVFFCGLYWFVNKVDANHMLPKEETLSSEDILLNDKPSPTTKKRKRRKTTNCECNDSDCG